MNEDNTTISGALREARKLLGLGDFICIILRFSIKGEAAERAAAMVSSRVAVPEDEDEGRMPDAKRWLESKGFTLSYYEMLEWRLKWLDQLIHEFETKGD